jgi:PKD repeat protein
MISWFKHIQITLLFMLPLLAGGYNMCTTNSATDSIGYIFDSGGPNGNYGNNQNCQFLIIPGCNAGITITFSAFNLENSYDFLYVYDGNTPSGKLLLRATGSSIPASVTAFSDTMLLVFYSDPSVTYSGFSASWSTNMLHSKPVSFFNCPTTHPPLNSALSFTDLSSNFPRKWHWNFGDGDTSTRQNPYHAYSLFDTFRVTLTVFNCFGNDSFSMFIYPQDSAFISIVPDTFSYATYSCNDTIIRSLKVKNTGRGDLVYSFSAGDTSNGIRLVSLIYGVDYTNEYTNTINAITQYFQNMTISEKSTVNADTLRHALINKNMLLIAEQETGSPAIFQSFGPVLRDYVYQGGNVIFCGSVSSQSKCMFNTGLFHGSYARNDYGNQLIIRNRQHPLCNNLDTVLFGNSATYSMSFTDQNIVHLISDSNNNDILAYREYGIGKVFFVAPDFDNYDSNSAKMIANIFKWVNSGLIPPWLVVNASSDTIPRYDSATVPIRFETHGLRSGNYYSLLRLYSNDIKTPKKYIRCKFSIYGNPAISLSASALQFDTCMQYADITDTVIITNTGCDSLKISGLHLNTSHFYTNSSGFTVLPGESHDLPVHFHPLATGNITDTLKIQSNAGIKFVKLSGTTIYPSAAAIQPDSFSTSLSCNDSIQYSLTIKNTDRSPLKVDIEGRFARDSIYMLAFTYGVDYYWEYPNTIKGINSYYTGYHLSELNTTSASRLDSALQHNDVLLIPEQESGNPNIFSAFYNVLQSFVSAGGTVIFCGSNSTQMNSMFNTGLFSGTNGTIVFNNTSILNVIDTTHVITKGIRSTFPSLNATFTAKFTNTDLIRLVDYDGVNDVVAYRNIGKGRAIFIAFDFYDYDSNSSKIAANAVRSSVTQFRPGWISLSAYSDTISFNDSSLITVTLNSGGLDAGNYHYNIRIHTNDPLHPLIQVPVDLEVHCKPSADFMVLSNYVNLNDTIRFYDKSRNLPTAWEWIIYGANPDTLTQKNPVTSYPGYGLYNVKLVVSNAWGSDTLEKKSFIHVDKVAIMCTTNKSESDSGFIFDPGGPLSNYGPYQTCELLLAPPCAQSVTLFFDEFNLENNWDYLYIYDGPDAKGTLLKSLTGNTIPQPITAYSGKMFIKFVSDQLVEESGYKARWYASVPFGLPPVCSFSADKYSPPVKDPVSFTDSSSPSPDNWFWDFGDGKTSDQQNPKHLFYKPGIYNVKLVSGNCYGKDSSIVTINVQDYPVLSNPVSVLKGQSLCSDIDTQKFTIYNTGQGMLTYQADTGQKRLLELLTYTYGINTDLAYDNTLNALYRYYPDINLNEISTFDSSRLRKALANKDLLIVPEEQKGAPDVFVDFSYPLYEFVSKGGTVVFCGSYDAQSNCMFNSGLFNGSYVDYLYLSTDSITIVDTSNKITRGYGKKIPGQVITYYYSISNTDAVKLLTYQGNDVLTYRKIGKGTAIFAGFNFYAFSDTISKIFTNLIYWATSKPMAPWLTVKPSKAQITDSLEVLAMFDRTKSGTGKFSTTLAFYTNDTLKAKNYIPVQFTAGKNYLPVDLPDQAGFCIGDSIGLKAGKNFISYRWNDSMSFADSIIIKSSGTYRVVVSDSNFCESVDSTIITVHGLPVISISPVDSLICNNAAPVALNATPTGGKFSGTGVKSVSLYPDLTLPGQLTFYYSYTDSNGCSNTDSNSTLILKSPIVDLGNDTTIIFGDTLFLDAGTGFLSYRWTGGINGRYFNLAGFVPGDYLFYVDVTDSNGCEGTDTIWVTIEDSSVSVKNHTEKYRIKVYPNPAQGVLFIDMNFAEPAKTSFGLYSADGKEMVLSSEKMYGNSLEKLDISSLAKGIYILKVIHHKHVDRFRVVVY